MRSGDGLRGSGGLPAGAALGVLIDDVLGHAIIERRPAHSWPVSAENPVDYVARPPSNGHRVQASPAAMIL